MGRIVHLWGGIGAVIALLALSGCGGSGSAQATATATPHTAPHRTVVSTSIPPTDVPVVPTDTPLPLPTATPTATPRPTNTRVPRPSPTPTRKPVVVAPVLISASASPASVQSGDSVQIVAQTSGDVARATVFLTQGPGTPGKSYALTNAGPGSWGITITAPSTPGTYHFTVSLYDAAGRFYPHDNNAWNFEVEAVPSGGTVPATIPADIPLAPPFSYSNPLAATFSADGQSVNGAEVISNSRPDIAPSTVSQFYLSRFPRSGWTVDPSTEPAAGATSFTIVANSGSRVCVVTYASAVVHVFFGTLPG